MSSFFILLTAGKTSLSGNSKGKIIKKKRKEKFHHIKFKISILEEQKKSLTNLKKVCHKHDTQNSY